jgi:serine/threonine protein kinase
MNIKVLAKTSSSPSLIITFTNEKLKRHSNSQLIAKLWLTYNERKEELPVVNESNWLESEQNTKAFVNQQVNAYKNQLQGLDYERRVYQEVIMPKIGRNKPFIPLVAGAKHATLEDVFAIFGGTPDDYNYFFGCIVKYIELMSKKFNYSNLRPENLQVPKKWGYLDKVDFSCIVMPQMELTTFADVCTEHEFPIILLIFIKICFGLKLLYDNKIVHNDLHRQNILVSSDGDVKIYDFDRSYIQGQPNPLLNDDCTVKPCASSQCNIYHEGGYCIDFYKLLSYLTADIDVFQNFVKVLGLDPDKLYEDETLYDIFYSARETFFSKKVPIQTSFLQCPESSKQWMLVIRDFGPLDTILSRLVTNGTRYLIESGNEEYIPEEFKTLAKAGFAFRNSQLQSFSKVKIHIKSKMKSLGNILP